MRPQLAIGASPYASPSSNRLTATAGPTPAKSNTYDAAGNLLSDGSVTYTYSDRGRLASATKSGVTTRYLYNGLGQRVAKVGSSQPGGRLNFVYDEAGHLLGEYDGTGKVVQEVVWLGDLPIATIWPSAAGAVRYFIQPDHLGTPRIITNVANAIVWRWDWSDPFGVNAPQFAPAGAVLANFNLRFPGQYADKESNTFYNYFRNYSPQEGRYLQSDPIGLQGGINTYGYVEGNPMSWADPDGLRARPFGSGNASQRRYDRRHAPERPAGHEPSGAWSDAAGYFNDEGEWVCLRWRCPGQDMCFKDPYDSRGRLRRSTDFIPAATDAQNPPDGCVCDLPGWQKTGEPGLWDKQDWLDLGGKIKKRWGR